MRFEGIHGPVAHFRGKCHERLAAHGIVAPKGPRHLRRLGTVVIEQA